MSKRAHGSQPPKAVIVGTTPGEERLVAVGRPEELEVAATRDQIWVGLNGGTQYTRSCFAHAHELIKSYLDRQKSTTRRKPASG